jgi:hypothetical protein
MPAEPTLGTLRWVLSYRDFSQKGASQRAALVSTSRNRAAVALKREIPRPECTLLAGRDLRIQQ